MRGSAVQVRLVALLASQPHLRPNSRIVGYATVAVVTLAVLFFSWRIYTYTELERDHIWVHFSGNGDLIGSLQEDDPVAIQGVKVGQVEDISSDPTGVRARLRFWKHQRIFRDAHAENVGNGLMGMRYVLLDPGVDSLHPLDRNALVEGIFRPGIAEVMSGIKSVVAKVNDIRLWIGLQATGNDSISPLHEKVLFTLDQTDVLLLEIDRIVRKTQGLGPSLQAAGQLSRSLADSLHSMEPNLIDALNSTDSILRQTQDLLGKSGKLVRRADTLARTAAAPLEPLTKNDSLLRKIERTLKLVDKVQSFVDGKAKLRYRFHIIGNNPSKQGE